MHHIIIHYETATIHLSSHILPLETDTFLQYDVKNINTFDGCSIYSLLFRLLPSIQQGM